MKAETEPAEAAANRRSWLSSLTLDLTPLRVSSDFRLLYIGQFVSAFGTAISYVVLPWQMYQLTQSSLYVGLLGVAEFVPMITLAFLGGALADYVDRRRLILLTETGLLTCCGILVWNALLPQPEIWVLFLVAALFAGLNALSRPALEALTPRLLPPEHLAAVSALNTFRYSFCYIVGPALAGLLAAGFGAAIAFAIDLATYAVAIGTIVLLRKVPAPVQGDKLSFQSIADGLRYARSRPEILGSYLIDIIAMFFGMPIALFPALAASFGGASVGMFYSMLAVGPLLVSLTSGWTKRVHRHGLAITLAVVVWGLAIVGFGLADRLWLAMSFLVVAGGADCASGLFRMTLWNQTIPDRLRGRLASIEMISYSSGPYLGNAESGLVAAWMGLRFSVISGGVLTLLGTGLLVLLLPQFLRYDGRDGVKRKEEEERGEGNGQSPSSEL